jgi:Carboxypeptidase regulatory-like domain
MRVNRAALRFPFLFLATSGCVLWGAATGSLSGTVRDPSGAVIPAAALTLENTALKTRYRAISDGKGFYSFPTLPVGHYDLMIEAPGFKTEKKTDLIVDADAALTVDASMEVGEKTETVTVATTEATTEAQVDTVATHLGELVTGSQMTALPLNGRSYADLLAIQPGVIPVTTLQPSSVIMAGVTGAISPSGDLNAGNESINGQRESSNGFTVNGVDVQEHMNGGTSIIPNLDSIDEFRVLTNNFDPEYGNYNGGMINVVTKSGTDSFHGSGFEFFRNTVLDARGYFDPTRPEFHQNQFGGTLGGPVKRQKIFFLGLSGYSDHTGNPVRTDYGAVPAGPNGRAVRPRAERVHDHDIGNGQTTCQNLGLSAPCQVTSPSTVAGYLILSRSSFASRRSTFSTMLSSMPHRPACPPSTGKSTTRILGAL